MKRILVVESDAPYAEKINNTLTGHGLEVEVVNDGTLALQMAKSHSPDLILLCVELPKMSGYSICNKLKKNPDLKGIPLVITSSEATPDIFEQHKKLKTRAEDYLIKPFPMDDLLMKVTHLLGLPPPGEFAEVAAAGLMEGTTAEVPEESGTVAYPDGMPPPDVDVDVAQFSLSQEGAPAEQEPPTRVYDNEIAAATDLAFAALELGEEASAGPTEKMHVLTPSEAAVEKGMITEGEPITAPPVEPLEMDLQEDPDEAFEVQSHKVPAVPPRRVEAAREREPRTKKDLPDVPPPVEPEPSARAAAAPPPGEDEGLRRKIQELERENRRLNDEVQNAKARVSASDAAVTTGFSRDRELLNLREVINKKEKEILDLKDDLDSKERQILDHKDKVRELERKVRDMDEKLLGVEREMVSANERMQAQQQDKEKLQERERGVKARLEEAKQEIEKSYAENDALKTRQKEAVDKLQSDMDVALAAKDDELSGMRDQHAGELDRLQRQQASELESLRGQHSAALQQAAQDRAAALATAEEQQQEALRRADEGHRNEVASINERHDRETANLRAAQNEEINRLQAEHERSLQDQMAATEERIARLNKEHDDGLHALRGEHEAATQQLRGENAEELRGVAERQRQELERRDADHAGEKEALRTEHGGEVERLNREHAAAVEELRQEQARTVEELKRGHADQVRDLEQRHKDRIAGMEARHRGAVEELDGKISEGERRIVDLEANLAGTQKTLEETRVQVRGLEGDLSAARETIGERDGRITSLGQQVAGQQDQLLRAYNKIRSDEQLADKAKRAMAIAITLLEEQKKVSAEGERRSRRADEHEDEHDEDEHEHEDEHEQA